jgi:succinoglycan biosynthesis protein ExoM
MVGGETSVTNAVERVAVVVAVCTYNRHGPLAVLLEAVAVNALRLGGRASVGVVVVDDSTDANARPVVERFAGRFELGLSYLVSGRQNIALARNMTLEAAVPIADWIALTDDDCEPAPDWLEALLEVQQRTGADAVSGILRRRVPPGSPRWLTEEPFLDAGLWVSLEDGAEVSSGATHNSMISARWLEAHPAIRFEPSFGVTGGEDPVFFTAAHAAGLRIHYASRAVVHENEPPSRATLGYQLRMFYWLGNNSYLTSVRNGTRPLRMFLHGGNLLARAMLRPLGLIARGRRPQLRYGLASMFRAVGVMSGPLGVEVPHP